MATNISLQEKTSLVVVDEKSGSLSHDPWPTSLKEVFVSKIITAKNYISLVLDFPKI